MKLELALHDLTPKQKKILRSKSDFMILRGPAGTAKTYTALAKALHQVVSGTKDRIVIIRSAVEIRAIGFQPGDSNEKMAVFSMPYVHLIDSLSPKRSFKSLKDTKVIEFHSTSFLRGTTFDDTIIVADEYQNFNAHELDTIVTRVGENTGLILCGDSDQSDLKYNEAEEHKRIIAALELMNDFEVVEFTENDIVRSGFIQRYYAAKRSLNAGN